MNILLVDDTPDHLELLAEFLQELRPDATIHAMQDGHDLPEFLEGHPVDLVMMDLLMPSVSGMDLIREVRKSKQGMTLPIVATSGIRHPESSSELAKAGFTDFLAKPWELDDLVRILDRHVPQTNG